jgi:hypothetical protein
LRKLTTLLPNSVTHRREIHWVHHASLNDLACGRCSPFPAAE